MKNTQKEWIVIAEKIIKDPSLKIKCPNCGYDYLQVWDEPFQADPSRLERHVCCENCKWMNSILINSELNNE